jgi:hypothetical protein
MQVKQSNLVLPAFFCGYKSKELTANGTFRLRKNAKSRKERIFP